jgi:hypothetical protein
MPRLATSAVPLPLSGVELTKPRAKTIARPTRVLGALVFRAAIETCGYSYRQVARWLDVSEIRVREYVAGERPIPLDVVLSLPPRFEEAVAGALVGNARARAIVVVSTQEGESNG